MKKTIIQTLLAAMLLLPATYSCKTPTKIDSAYATVAFKPECMGTDMDGTQTLRVFGKGKNRAQAIESARKNAVSAVIFDGITAGSAECNKRPLLTMVNAREKYETYFDRFFADGGAYTEYVSAADEKRTSRIKASNNSIENWGVVVRVDRAALRDRLMRDGILSNGMINPAN